MTITLYLNQDRPTCSVVRYSDGGDGLEWFHDHSLRRAIEIVAELIRLHNKCSLEVSLCDGCQVVQTFTEEAP